MRWERPATGKGAPFITRDASGARPYRVELCHFFDRLRDGAPFQVDGDEALRSLRLALAVLDAVQTGAVQTLTAGGPGGAATYAAAATPSHPGRIAEHEERERGTGAAKDRHAEFRARARAGLRAPAQR